MGDVEAGEAGIIKNFSEVIDILADADNSKLKFFINVEKNAEIEVDIKIERDIELTEEEFTYYLTENSKFKVNYREDGVVEISTKIYADKVLEKIRNRVWNKVQTIMSESWTDE